jgi:hypothetical protein
MRLLLAIPLLCLSCLPCRAGSEQIEPLDAEFLEYLAAFGSDSEDWVLFADDEPVEPAAGKQDSAKEGGPKKTEAAAKPADER